MFGKSGDSYKRKTKIKKDIGSSGDQGGEIHQRTKIKQKRSHGRGTHMMMAPGTNVMPVTSGMRGRGARNQSSSSSSSSSENRHQNIGTRNVQPTGFGTGMGTTGYNQTYAPTTMTAPITGQHLDSFNQTTTKKVQKPGFVEKIKYKLRSRR